MSTEPKLKATEESEVWSAISAFEQILDAIPNDRVALETLFEAYEQIGQTARAVEYLVRLGQSVCEEQDTEAAPEILAKLRPLADSDPAAGNLVEQLEGLLVDVPAAAAAQTAAVAESTRKTSNITGELSLAWNLLQAGELTQDQYSTVVQDLSESSTRNVDTPVTVLHVLHGRGNANLEKILTFLSKDSNTPILSLSTFDLQRDAFTLLPLEYMQTHAAIVFQLMGADAIVATLNPYDNELREQVRSMVNRNCHFYLATVNEYDAALDGVRKALAAFGDE